MITSPHNEQLKTIRKLREKKHREELRLFVAEGEDLVDAASAAGWEPRVLLVAGEDIEPELLASVSSLGSGTRVLGVYEQRWSSPGGSLSVYLHGVHDPGNVGTVIRSAHALCDGPLVLGPDCADPWSPKAVRASMGSVFARPPARAEFPDLEGMTIALERGAGLAVSQVAVSAPAVVCLGGEREGLPSAVGESATVRAEIPLRADGPDSLNVAMAATIALYDFGSRMAADA